MKIRQSLILGLISLVLLVVFNGLAYKYFWYWHYPWADVPMHLLGGMAIVSWVLFLANQPVRVWPVLGLLALVVFGWELFEFKFSHFLPTEVVFKALPAWERGLADTFSDIIFGVLGGLLAFGWLADKHNLNHDQKIEA